MKIKNKKNETDENKDKNFSNEKEDSVNECQKMMTLHIWQSFFYENNKSCVIIDNTSCVEYESNARVRSTYYVKILNM